MTKQVKSIFSFFLSLSIFSLFSFLSSGELKAASLYFVSHSPYMKSKKDVEYSKELALAQRASQILSLSKNSDDLKGEDPIFFDLKFLYQEDLQYKKIPSLPIPIPFTKHYFERIIKIDVPTIYFLDKHFVNFYINTVFMADQNACMSMADYLNSFTFKSFVKENVGPSISLTGSFWISDFKFYCNDKSLNGVFKVMKEFY